MLVSIFVIIRLHFFFKEMDLFKASAMIQILSMETLGNSVNALGFDKNSTNGDGNCARSPATQKRKKNFSIW